MSLLLPDAGLLFWTLIAFGIVFFVLYKYGFPVITSMLDERKRVIEESLRNANVINERLARIEEEGEAIIKAARDEKIRILREAESTREHIIDEAIKRAGDEGEKMLLEVRRVIEHEKENVMRDIRSQVAELSLSVAERIMREGLSNDERQQEYIKMLADEVLDGKEEKK